MDERTLTRSEFLRGGSCLAAGAVLGAGVPSPGACGSSPCAAGDAGGREALTLRPYQLLCLICAVGESGTGPTGGRLKEVAGAVRDDPDLPILLRCNAGDVYAYQDPGASEDTSEGADFNRKRDLDVLRRMNWAPGITLPARTMIMSLLRWIPSVAGICGYGAVTSEAWRGCPKAGSGFYEKGREKGVEALIPPRSELEMAAEKERSMAALAAAGEVTIRPHILLCAVCQYGSGTRPPYKADNLPELLDLVLRRKPDLPIRLVRGADWLMCAPCPQRAGKRNACVNVLGSGGLSNEKRDLDMLQVLGLTSGSTMKARELFGLIFGRIATTQEICRRDNPCPSVWWDPCGERNVKEGNGDYEKGRRELMEMMGLR